MREEWKKLGVRSVQMWCDKVEDHCWLTSKLGGGKKKKKKWG